MPYYIKDTNISSIDAPGVIARYCVEHGKHCGACPMPESFVGLPECFACPVDKKCDRVKAQDWRKVLVWRAK